MTPHDSTRCGTGCITPSVCHPFFCNRVLQGTGVLPSPTPALPTEGVGAVDALERHCDALLDFESALRSDGFTVFVDEYVGRLRLIRAEATLLREQVATLTREIAQARNANQRAEFHHQNHLAAEAELAALRATPAEGSAVAYLNVRVDGAKVLDYEPWKEPWTATPLYAAPVPSGVTGSEQALAADLYRLIEQFAANGDFSYRQEWDKAAIAMALKIRAALAAAEQGGG